MQQFYSIIDVAIYLNDYIDYGTVENSMLPMICFSYFTNYATVTLIESILMFSQVATFDLLYALVKADKDTIRPMYFTFGSD